MTKLKELHFTSGTEWQQS